MTILIFDTETTGLLPTKNPDYNDFNSFDRCRIVSIAWNIYQDDGFLIRSRYHIVKPSDFAIDDNSIATQINKITGSIANNGSQIDDIWNELSKDLLNVDLIVAHNIVFDKTILLAELARSRRNDIISKINTINTYCTMIGTISLCKLPFPSGKGLYKYPKLQELHEKLFGYNFKNDHKANADVEATASCYFELKNNPIYNGI